MRVTVLGSGTGWFRRERCAPGYLVNVAGLNILLDLGPGILRQLLNLGFTLNDLSGIFISHFHPDHVSDLIPFLFATRYHLGYTRTEKVYLIVHQDFLKFYQGLTQAFGSWIEPLEGTLECLLIPEQDFSELSLGQLKIKTAKVKHNPESLALRLEHQGKSLIYAGDTGYSEHLIRLALGGDLLILECANGRTLSVPHHLGPEEVALIASKSKVKKILITHLYPHSEPVPLELIKKWYHGEVLMAEDFLKIDL